MATGGNWRTTVTLVEAYRPAASTTRTLKTKVPVDDILVTETAGPDTEGNRVGALKLLPPSDTSC